jgi:tetratricopeptide (TPR) repeat protein
MRRRLTAALAASLLLSCATTGYAAQSASGVSNAVETHIKRGAPRMEDLDSIQTYVQKTPTDLHARFVLGELLASGGYQELASEQFDEIGKTSPNHVLNEFHDLLRGHSYEAARWIGYYVSKKWPNDSGVLFAMGRQSLLKGQRRSALTYLDKARQASPVWPEVYLALAEVMFSYNRKDEAKKYAEQALEINPGEEAAMAIKTASQAELSGRPEQYLGNLEKYAARNWSNDSVSLQLTMAYINRHEWDKAVEPALYALKYSQGPNKKLAEQHLKLLMTHVPSGKIISDLNTIAPLDPRNYLSTVLRMRVAKIVSDLGAHQQAIKLLVEALNMHPYFTPEINYRLGMEYAALDQPKEALVFYKMAHDMRPEDLDYEHAYQRTEMRFQNHSNDLARKLKKAINKNSRD